MDDRPRGVTLLGVLAILGGVLHLIPSTLLLIGGVIGMLSGMFTTTGQAGAPASGTGVVYSGLGLIGVIAALVLIVAGIGVLQLSSWAWPLAVIAALVSLVGAAVRLILVTSAGSTGNALVQFLQPFGRDATVVSEAIALILCGVALVYLCTPSVRAAFGRYPDATASL